MAETEKEDKGKVFDNLSGTQKSAILMMLLGEDEASEILKNLTPKEVQHLGSAMYSVEGLDQDTVNKVLDEFLAIIKEQTSLGLGAGNYIQNVLNKALGQDRAQSILGRIIPSESNNAIEILEWMDSRAIAELIQDEHPQVIAIILSVLEYDVAADVLNFLAAEIRAEVVQRIAMLDTVQPNAMEELESIMKKQFSNSSSAKSSSFGGIGAAAKIMNFTKVELESTVLQGVADVDEELALKIQDNMFTFDNLSALDNRGVQVLMRNVESDMLMISLKGADEPVKEKFLDNMSSRAKVMFLDEMEAKGPIRITDVEEAQKSIVRIARKLSDAGELVLAGRGDDFV